MLKNILRCSLLLLFIALCSGKASAQLFTNHFSTYETYSFDSSNIYSTATISGYTVIGGDSSMAFTATHTPTLPIASVPHR